MTSATEFTFRCYNLNSLQNDQIFKLLFCSQKLGEVKKIQFLLRPPDPYWYRTRLKVYRSNENLR